MGPWRWQWQRTCQSSPGTPPQKNSEPLPGRMISPGWDVCAVGPSRGPSLVKSRGTGACCGGTVWPPLHRAAVACWICKQSKQAVCSLPSLRVAAVAEDLPAASGNSTQRNAELLPRGRIQGRRGGSVGPRWALSGEEQRGSGARKEDNLAFSP